MAAYEILLLNTAIPQIQAAQSGDTYVVPRDIAINATAIISANSATDALRITQTGAGNAILVEDSANPDTTPFVVTATGDVGIGTTSPAQPLDVVSNSSANAISIRGRTADDIGTLNFSTNAGSIIAQIQSRPNGNELRFLVAGARSQTFYTNGSEQMRLDSSGNLGLGVTPSAWSSSWKVMQLGGGTTLSAWATDAGTNLSANAFNDGSWKRIDAAAVAQYSLTSTGEHRWNIAGSSTAGSAITFTQAMTLDASGNLGVGTTSPSYKLQVYGNDPAIAIQANTGTSDVWTMQSVGSDSRWRLVNNTSGYGEVFTVTRTGNVKLGGTADRATTAGTNHLDIFNGTAPVGTLANGISIYSSSGEAYVMDAAGNATLFSPHDAETNEWIFKSKHTPTGKVLKIDVERLLKFVNDHFGLDAVHEFVEE